MSATDCTRLRTRDGASSRCGDCAGCVQRREELYRMFEGGESYDRIVEVTGLHRSIVRAYRERWRMVRKLKAKRERSEGSEQDRYVERPMCACGLSLDETHTAETCDMATREHRSTGTGQWGWL